MKLILLSLLVLMASCNDSPGGGAAAPVSEETSESQNRPEIEDVVNDLDEGELNKINDAFRSLGESVRVESELEIDSQYRVQKSRVFATDEGPVTYLFNYHAEGTKIFKIDVDTQKYETYQSKSKAKIHSVINHNKEVYLITKKPVRILKLDSKNNSASLLKNPFSDDEAKLLRTGMSKDNLFLKGNNDQIYSLNLVTSESKLHRGKGNIVQVLGNSDAVLYKLLEEKLSSIYKIVDGKHSLVIKAKLDEKLTMFKRGGEVFVRHTLLKNEIREKRKHIHLKLEGSSLNSFIDRLPKNKPSFGYLKTYLDFSETTKNNPAFKFGIRIKKTKEKFLEIELADGVKTKNSYNRFFQSNNELFLTTRSIKGLYQLKGQDFEGVALPHNLNINSINYLEDKYILGANGRYVLEYGPGSEGKLESKVLKRLSKGYSSSILYNEKIIFIRHLAKRAGTILFDLDENLIHTTEAEFRFYKTNSEEELLLRGISSKAVGNASVTRTNGEEIFKMEGSNKVLKVLKWDSENYYYIQKSAIYHYDSSTAKASKMMTLSGPRVNHLIKTPNDKLLLVNDGQVQIYNPATRSLASLTSLDMKSLVKIRSFTLKENMLYFIDKLNKLHKVTIPNHKLTLFDEI